MPPFKNKKCLNCRKCLKVKNLFVKKNLYLQNKNMTSDLLQLPTTNTDIELLKKQQYFTENTNGDIFTLKNVIVGSDKNIDTTNIYSKSISINRVSKSITQFYESILNVNTIVNFILSNVEQIKVNGFENVLRPFAENTFYEDQDYFWVLTCPNTDNEEILKNEKTLFSWKKYDKYTGITVKYLLDLYKEGKYIYFKNEAFSSDYNNSIKYFKLFEKYKLNEKNYYNDIKEWGNGIILIFKCIVQIPNILPNIPGFSPNHIIICSAINLDKTIEDINEIKLFSPEYIRFITTLSDNTIKLHEIYNNLIKNIFTSTILYSVWEYNTTSPLLSVCYYSNEFSDIIGKRASDAFIIGNTTINFQNMIPFVINFNSKNLLLNGDGEVGVIEYTYNNLNYTILTKIVILNGKKYIIMNTIPINPFFNNAIQTNGDVEVEGSLSINNIDGKNSFNLNTNTSVLELNGKIGINTPNPRALLDIQGISNIEISVITDQQTLLNKFIFSVYDYFIDNFSKTTNRDWRSIYNSNIDKNKISITTLNLPFDFRSATSESLNFSLFIENFNDYIKFDYVEEEFKQKYEGKHAGEIKDPYFTNYFNELKMYFLTIWNQREYYILTGYQTFTNIVNYFGGPVLRMHVMWYDTTFNVIHFFSSNLRLDKYLLNNRLSSILIEYFNSLFACEQLTNLYSNLLKDPEIQKKQYLDPLYLTKFVNNSYFKERFGFAQNYVFCTDYFKENRSDIKYWFTEQAPFWATNKLSKLLIPGQDLLISNAVDQILDYIEKNYKFNLDRLSLSFYFFAYEYKVSYIKFIECIDLEGIKRIYAIGSGVDILNFINKNIISNGDHQFNGSLRLVEPVSNQTVVTIDTTEKQVAIQYPLGLGTENPRSILTIDDVSITNLFDYLDELSRKKRYISDLCKIVSSSSSQDIKDLIENYINPFTGKKFEQYVDNYFRINEFNTTNILKDKYDNIIIKYSWYLKLWVNKSLKFIFNNSNFDTINNGVKAFVKQNIDLTFLSESIYNNNTNINYNNDIWGKKASVCKYILKENTNNILYRVSIGINFSAYFTRFNTNKNLNNIILAIQYIQSFLNDLYLSKKKMEPINKVSLQPFIENVKKESGLFKLWIMDCPDNIDNTRLYLKPSGDLPTNLDGLISTDTIYNMLYKYDTSNHGNLSFDDVNLYYQKIINLRQKIAYYNGNLSLLIEQDTNTVGIRTDEEYWITSWMCMNIEDYKNLIVVCEINVDDYLNQSVQMIGDLQMAGNLTLMNPREYFKYVRDKVPLSSLNPLISIYPEEEFVGIGSQKIYTQYVLNYKTIDLQMNSVFAKNHVVVSNPYYPNLVGERIADPSTSLTRNDSIKSSFSAFTARRKTRVFTLDDIVRDGDGKFGIDISYELEDKYEDAYEIAQSGVSIVGVKKFKNGINYPVPKYFWNIVSDATDKNTIEKTTIMELESSGRLNVSKIRLGKYDLEAVDNCDGTQSLRWGNVIIARQ